MDITRQRSQPKFVFPFVERACADLGAEILGCVSDPVFMFVVIKFPGSIPFQEKFVRPHDGVTWNAYTGHLSIDDDTRKMCVSVSLRTHLFEPKKGIVFLNFPISDLEFQNEPEQERFVSDLKVYFQSILKGIRLYGTIEYLRQEQTRWLSRSANIQEEFDRMMKTHWSDFHILKRV